MNNSRRFNLAFKLFLSVSLLVSTLLTFSSCENFLNGEDVKEEIQKSIEYSNAESYEIDVEVFDDSCGAIKTPATGSVVKKVTDSFTVRFQPAADHKFIKWEAVVKGMSTGEKASDYIEFENSDSQETKVYFKKASASTIVIRPVCPPRLTYKFVQGGGDLYPRDSSIELIFNQKLSNCSLNNTPISYITIPNLAEGEDVSKYFQAPVVTNEKILFRADTKEGTNFIPVSTNSRSIQVRIPKEDVWYVNKDYTEPVQVYLDDDVSEAYLIGSQTSAKTKIKFDVRQKDEKPIGTLKINGIDNDNQIHEYSVGETLNLRYKVPEGYTFKKLKFVDSKGQELKKDNLSISLSDEDNTNNLVQITLTIDNQIKDEITIIPEITDPVIFKLLKASEDKGTLKAGTVAIAQEEQTLEYGISDIISLTYKLPAGYYFYGWEYSKTYKNQNNVERTDIITRADLKDLGIDIVYDKDGDENGYEKATRIATAQITISEYTDNIISIKPISYENLQVTKFKLDDEEKTYERDSDIVFTFNKPLAPACKDNVTIRIPGLPEGKTYADYFEPAVIEGNTLTIKPKKATSTQLIPLLADGTNTITVSLKTDKLYYETKASDNSTVKVGLESDKTYTYKIDATTKEKTKIKVQYDPKYSYGTLKIDGSSRDVGTENGYSIGNKAAFTFTLEKEDISNYYFKGWKLLYITDGTEESTEINLNDNESLKKLNISFEDSGKTGTVNDVPIYGAEITVDDAIDGVLTLQPVLAYIDDIELTVDGTNGKFTPAKGTQLYKLGQTYHVEFEPDSDYAFIRWKLINAKTGEEFERNENNNTYIKYLRASSLSDEKLDFELYELPEEDIELELCSVIAERPQIISNTPLNTQLVNRDSTIQVVFDYDMDEDSIYYTDKEKEKLEDDGVTTFLYKDDDPSSKCYGYEDSNGETIFKNISIKNNKTGETITQYYSCPIFENPKTLSISVKRTDESTNEVDIAQYTQILVNLDKGFFYSEKINETLKKEVYMGGAKKWIYQVNDTIDTSGPKFVNGHNPKFTIGENVLERSATVPGLSESTISVSSLPYYKTNNFNLEFQINDDVSGSGASGAANIFNLECTKEYDENYQKLTNCPVQNIGIEYDYLMTQNTALYDGNCKELNEQLSSGIYSVRVVAIDKCGNKTYYPANNDANPNKKFYICIDKTGPSIAYNALTFDEVSEEGVIKPKWSYSDFPDYDYAVIKYADLNSNGTYSSPANSKTVQKGNDAKISGLLSGRKYRFDISYFDLQGNSTRQAYYYAYTIPAKPASVSVRKGADGTSAIITASKPSEGDCTSLRIRYKTGNTDWTTASSTITGSSGNVTVSGLTRGKTYEFEVCAYDSVSKKYSLPYKVSSAYPSIDTAPDSPATISTDFMAYTNQGTVTWSAPASGDYTGFVVYRSTDSNFSSSSTVSVTLGSNVTSHTFTGLTAGTDYYTKVVAYYGNTTNLSAAKTAQTWTRPVAPTNLTCSSRTNTSITVSWTAPASGYWSYYELWYKKSTASDYTKIQYVDRSSTSYPLSGLEAGVTYDFQLYSKYQETLSTVTTGQWQLCPNPATNIATTKLTDTSLKVTWNSPSGTYSGYNLYISRTVAGLSTANPIELSAERTTYTETNLVSKAQYYVKIETYIGTNDASRLKTDSNSIGCSLAFDAVKDVYIESSSLTTSSFKLCWTNPSIAFDGIEIYYGETKLATLSNTANSYSLSGKAPNTSYTYRIVTYKGSGTSRLAAENVVTAVTKAASISNQKVSVVGANSVKVSWTNPADSEYSKVKIYNVTTGTYTDVSKTTTVKTLTGLTGGTSYTFRVITENSKGSESYPSGVSVTTTPSPVTNLTYSSSSPTQNSIYVWWTKPAGNYTGVKIYYKKSTVSSWGSPITISGTSTNYKTITGLTAGTTYDVQVVSYLTNVGESTETTISNCYTKPPAATNLKFVSRNGYKLTYSWSNPNSSNYDYVKIYYRKYNGSYISNTSNLTKGTNSYTLNLDYGYRYDVRIDTYYNNLCTEGSWLQGYATTPAVPTNLRVDSKNKTMTFSWTEPLGNQNYNIKYRLAGGSSWNGETKNNGTNSINLTINDGKRYEFLICSVIESTDGYIGSADSSSVYYYAPPPSITRVDVGSGSGYGNNTYMYYFKIKNYSSIKNYISGFRVYNYDNGWKEITSYEPKVDDDGYYNMKFVCKTGSTVVIIPYHTWNSSHSENPGYVSTTHKGETYGKPFTMGNLDCINYVDNNP